MIDDGLNYRIVMGRIVWPEKDKPMTTNPTADAAKPLPCPFGCNMRDGPNPECPEHWKPRSLEDLSASDEKRPQPAPPAGEPDFHRWLDQKIAEWSAAGGFHDFAVAAKIIRDRLGLAVRPKVQDAEVAEEIKTLRSTAEGRRKADDEFLADWYDDLADLLEDRAVKLAEREAELAKADEVIAYMPLPPFGEQPAFNTAHRDEARKRHATRQQQKDDK